MPRLIYQRYKQLYSRKQKDEKQESPTHHFSDLEGTSSAGRRSPAGANSKRLGHEKRYWVGMLWIEAKDMLMYIYIYSKPKEINIFAATLTLRRVWLQVAMKITLMLLYTPTTISFIGCGECWPLMKIKLMSLPQSTYCSERVANFNVMIIRMWWWCDDGDGDGDDDDDDHDDCKRGATSGLGRACFLFFVCWWDFPANLPGVHNFSIGLFKTKKWHVYTYGYGSIAVFFGGDEHPASYFDPGVIISFWPISISAYMYMCI